MAASPSAAQTYPVYTVSTLPLNSVAALNDAGQILGRSFLPCSGLCAQSESPVLYDTRTGSTTALGGGFGPGPQFHALNGKGQLAGSSTTQSGTGDVLRNVVIRQPDGTLTTLTAPTRTATQTSGLQVRGLNAAGQMVLQHTDGLDAFGPLCGNYQGWVGTGIGTGTAAWKPLGAASTVLRLAGINASGVGVGASVPAAQCGAVGVAGGGFHATATLPNGTPVDLHTGMPGTFSRASAINDLGYAVGDYDSGARTLPDANFPQGLPIARAVVWNTAARVWFDMGPAASVSRLNAVNNRGEVVGSTTASVLPGQPYPSTASRAVLGNLATPWPLVDLNTLLANNSAGWVLQDALAINASGQIVARGVSAAGSGVVLLTPVGLPADPYAVVPAAPASLALSQVAATSATLTWTHSARNATRLVVERCRGNGCTAFVAVATLPSDTTRYAETALLRRTAYRWRVRAGNATGLSLSSNVVAATTLR